MLETHNGFKADEVLYHACNEYLVKNKIKNLDNVEKFIVEIFENKEIIDNLGTMFIDELYEYKQYEIFRDIMLTLKDELE